MKYVIFKRRKNIILVCELIDVFGKYFGYGWSLKLDRADAQVVILFFSLSGCGGWQEHHVKCCMTVFQTAFLYHNLGNII